MTPLHKAAKYSHLRVVKLLIEDGHASLKCAACSKPGEGCTLLHLAMEYAQMPVIEYLRSVYRSLVNIPDAFLRTSLHHAAARGLLEPTLLLLRQEGVNVNASNVHRQRPIFIAVECTRYIYCFCSISRY